MSTTLSTLRRRLLRELDLGEIIVNADVDSIATTSITSANMLRNSMGDPAKYKGWIIFRPGAASAADYIRIAGLLTLTTGALAHTGANYSDTTVGSEVIELWKPGIRPNRELVDSLNRCLEFEYSTTLIPLSDGTRHDFGMTESTNTNYTSVGSPTVAKSTTQGLSYIPYGRASLTVANQAATPNEGVLSQSMRVVEGTKINVFAIVTVINSGTANLSLVDNTASAAFGDSVSHSEWQAQLVTLKNQTVPTDCLAMQLKMLGTASGSNIAWNGIWLLKQGEYKIAFPIFVAEAFQVKIVQAIPQEQTATNVYDARSLVFRTLVEGEDYRLIINHEDSQPYAVMFKDDSYYDWPLYIEARVPNSTYVTFAETETTATNIPVHNLLPRWKIDVLETCLMGRIPQDKWNMFRAAAEKQLIKASNSRLDESIAPEKPYWAPTMGA